MSNNQLNDISKTYLEAVYGGGKKKEAPKDDRMVVTAADKKANTKAYQNYKAGHKAYKAADHLKDDYEFARHKASIISRGGRLEDAVESWNQKLAYREAMQKVNEKKEVNVKDTYKTISAVMQGGVDESVGSAVDKALGAVGDTAKVAGKAAVGGVKVASKVAKGTAKAAGRVAGTVVGVAKAAKKGFKSGADTNEEKRWQDDDGDGKWYEKSDVDGKISKREKKATKHKCASKVKHEEFGIGNPVKGMHDLDESGKVAHYDVMFGHGVEKNVPVSSLEILEGHMHEHVIHETKAKRVKKESLSDWRTDLSSLIEIVAEPEEKAEKKVKEGKVNNKVVINPKISEAIQEMGGEVLEHHQVDCDDDCEPNCEHDTIEEGKGKKNCGCGQDPCITYGEQKEGDSLGKSQVDENRMTAYTAGMSDAQKDAATRKVSKRTIDSAGRRNDAAAFKSRKTGGKANRKYEKEIRKSIPSDKPNRNKTGRGQPVQYRKSADNPESEARFPYGRSKIVQGKGSIKDLKKESVEFFRRFRG